MTDLPRDLPTEEQRERRKRRKATPSPLIHAREVAGMLLGDCSTSTLIRYEKMGLLKPIRLSDSPNGKVYYTDENLRRLIARLESESLKKK